MHIKREQISATKTKLTISPNQSEINAIKDRVLVHLSDSVKVPGFREGKAPAALVEKQIDPNRLQSEFMEHSVNDIYVAAVEEQRLRPVAQPEISIVKFVPYTDLEFTAEVEVVGDIELADYKKIRLDLKKVEITAKDVNEVLENLLVRAAEKVPVERAAKKGDELVIDFSGSDAESKEPIAGGDGKDYPLVLGSNTFIPGFEDELIGAKTTKPVSFDITFPANYSVKDLQNRKVTFDVIVKTVNELQKPKLDDVFAATVGPFKTLAELKADIKKQLKAEKELEARTEFDNKLVQQIAEESVVPVPEALVNEEIDRMEEEEKRNITYRGQTWQEHLDAEGVSADEHRERQRPNAELRVKSGLVLGEIAAAEKIQVTPEELEIRLMLLRNQYTDPAMQAELDKPENRNDINSRLMTEKTLDFLHKSASQKTAN